ncbi:hypothetical protein KSC_002600 [Ktedonobacter sp. SOSP1-52]|uniref:DEAD/DEAH box helicase n=1 Tax=Ktedonobacter sp. SOSP1-52 TaxID=2778366 RepID=UPI0019157803|nr:DEAD/DEAH box helicase [Ktedonobacter sp. SOSP1-52]GHO61368.1 hypothetical protein KSC_002600 [Ktedonobacter sp. SOSP1-52]
MISVYFSHIGEIKTEQSVNVETVQAGTLKHILQELEHRHPGVLQKATDQTGERLNSATLIFKRIEVQGGRYLEGNQTAPVQTLNELISQEDENLLIAFFHPENVLSFLLDTLTATEDRFDTGNGTHKYRAYISSSEDKLGSQSLFAQSEPEALYPFTNGRPISELVAVDGLLESSRNKFISPSLRDAIVRLWEVGADFRLRLFQEDALVHIIRELTKADDSARQPLLLSIPTGGGKTEAFLVPLISHLHNQREKELRAGRIPSNRVRSMIIYPTRALANDQARRIAEILFLLNEGTIEDRKISVGVLTGDTPNSGYNLLTEKSLLQLCPHCSAVLTNFPEKEMQEGNGKLIIARCVCGAEIDYFRLTRQDILRYPPDILITSPDMINRMLQSPRYHKHIFSKAIDLVVFDEIHMYNSVFGCNIAHLLRRFEEACEHKPMYVGVSATIRNARELASLIFNTEVQRVKYLRPRRREEEETEEKRPYLDYLAPPTRYRYHYAIAPVMLSKEKQQKVITSVLNVADVIGHLLRDPHFRKTIIFSNFRQDTDDIVRYLRDQEDRYYSTYHAKLFPRLLTRRIAAQSGDYKPFSKIEADIISAVDRWYRRAYELGALYDEKLEIGWHRGGLERDERIKSVNRFSSAKLLHTSDDGTTALPIDVMVATSTLELGIDIGDVTTVINSGAPFTANEYTQRVGRGGRRKDSLALTVVDTRNPLDFYFLKHFRQYAHPTVDDFEDAPIIVSNEAVLKSHIYARFLDRLAYHLHATEKEEIQVIDLRNLRLSANGRTYTYQEDCEEIGEILFQEIFTRQRVSTLQEWIKQEARIIPDICETEISFDDIRAWWQGKWQQLYSQISSANGDMQDGDCLSGMTAKDRELVPDLRSSGPSVGMYLIRENGNDDLRDTVSRRQAISSRPVGGYASQGSVTFKIDTIKENDHSAEGRIKELFLTSAAKEAAARYFSRMFGDANNRSPFPDNPINVVIKTQFETPKDLAVKYNPYRFYCPQCGATYSDKRAGTSAVHTVALNCVSLRKCICAAVVASSSNLLSQRCV